MEAGFLIEKKCSMHGAISSSAFPDSSETFDWIHPRFQAQSASILFNGWYVCPWIHAWTSDCLDDPNSFCIFLLYTCESFLCSGVSSSGRSAYDSMSLGERFKRWKRSSLGSSWPKLIQMQDFFFLHPINRCQHHPNKCLSYAPCFLFQNV